MRHPKRPLAATKLCTEYELPGPCAWDLAALGSNWAKPSNRQHQPTYCTQLLGAYRPPPGNHQGAYRKPTAALAVAPAPSASYSGYYYYQYVRRLPLGPSFHPSIHSARHPHPACSVVLLISTICCLLIRTSLLSSLVVLFCFVLTIFTFYFPYSCRSLNNLNHSSLTLQRDLPAKKAASLPCRSSPIFRANSVPKELGGTHPAIRPLDHFRPPVQFIPELVGLASRYSNLHQSFSTRTRLATFSHLSRWFFFVVTFDHLSVLENTVAPPKGRWPASLG